MPSKITLRPLAQAQTPQKFVNKKINKLQNMGKTESVESFVSVESEIEVSMKDYYKIRMENRMASVSDCQREEEESKVFDSVANPVSGITVKSSIEKIQQKTEKEMRRENTSDSQVDVTEKDYYQIRFQTEAGRKAYFCAKFSLSSWSNFQIWCRNFQSTKVYAFYVQVFVNSQC